MSQDLPALDDVVRTAREFLVSVAPQLSRESAYDAQVAVYLLQIAEREIQQGWTSCERDNQSLQKLLGQSGTSSELLRTLSRQIRDGTRDADWSNTLKVTLELVVSKVSIVRPDRLQPVHQSASD